MEDRFIFRAWCKSEKQMYSNVQGTYDFGCNGVGTYSHASFQELLDDDGWIIMQCTGLRDKNNKLIFEGDIVLTQPFRDKPHSLKAKYKPHKGYVYYYIGKHTGGSKPTRYYECKYDIKINDYGDYGCCSWSAFYECEVIGNIYENPEIELND